MIKYRFAFCAGCIKIMKDASDEKNKVKTGWADDIDGEAWSTATDES